MSFFVLEYNVAVLSMLQFHRGRNLFSIQSDTNIVVTGYSVKEQVFLKMN